MMSEMIPKRGGGIAAVQPFDAFRSKSYFSALDGLRALSIFLVLLHHTSRWPDTNLIHTLQENGRYGVGFFFVISGFLICTLLLREEAKTGGINLWKFYGRRALRLLPLYYAVLILQGIFVFVLHQYAPENQQLFREKLPSYLFYYSNWLPTATQGPFFCAWSLAVEEQFYLGFGLLLFFARRPWVIAVTATALLVKIVVYHFFGAVDATSALWRIVFSYREPIFLGVLLAFALNRPEWYERFKRLLGSNWSLAAFGAATVLWLGLHPMQHESTWDAQLLYLLMTVTLAGLVMRPSIPVLGGKWVTHVGKISYGIYLLHMFVISSVRKLPGGDSPAVSLALTTVTVIVVASIVYNYFEYPFIAFSKRKLSPVNKTETNPSAVPTEASAPTLPPGAPGAAVGRLPEPAG